MSLCSVILQTGMSASDAFLTEHLNPQDKEGVGGEAEQGEAGRQGGAGGDPRGGEAHGAGGAPGGTQLRQELGRRPHRRPRGGGECEPGGVSRAKKGSISSFSIDLFLRRFVARTWPWWRR